MPINNARQQAVETERHMMYGKNVNGAYSIDSRHSEGTSCYEVQWVQLLVKI